MELPTILEVHHTHPLSVEFQLDIQPDLRCFQGHFVEAPVLAGVVQIDWVIHLARTRFAYPLVFCGLQSIKFMRLIRPPQTLSLRLDYLPERGLLKFTYRDQQVNYSAGAIRFDPAEVDLD